MNSMYDILAKMKLVESKGNKPDFLDLDNDGNRKESMKKAAQEVDETSAAPVIKNPTGFSATAPKGKQLTTTLPKDRPLAPGDVKVKEQDTASEYPHRQSKTFGHSHNMAPGYDPTYRSPIGSAAGSEIEELEYLMSKGAMSNTEENRLRALYRKYNINRPEDLARLPQLRQQELRRTGRTQQDLQRRSAEANVAARDEMERELARRQGAQQDNAQGQGTFQGLRVPPGLQEGLDMEEGNEFTKARTDAIRAGRPTFTVAGKTYKVTGDTRDEKQQVDEREMKDKDEFDRWANPGDYYKSTKGKVTKTEKGVRHERDAEEEQDDDRDDDKPRGRGRPKGSKRALGAKGPTGRSKLLNKGSIREGEVEEDYDRDEYDEEGEMAKSQARVIADAAQELQDILDDQENLPEWVQKKINLAKEYIDSARDYMKANRPEEETMMAEKAVSKAQRAAAGIAYAAKKGDIPKSELRGASKEMAKMPSGELKKFAKTKEKGLPEKKAEESVEETTTAGSVATAPAETPKGKKGMVFGKGVYEGQLAESYEKKLDSVLTEGMSINMSVGEDGQKSLTVSATDDDAVKLAEILKLAGMEQAQDYHAACATCGADEGMCEHTQIEEELANSPDPVYADTDTMVNKLSGGLNGPKRQINPNNMGDNPLAMTKLGKSPGAQVNLGETMRQVQAETEQRLANMYQQYKG
jgi:hypothetical protein